ncbi:isocitrate lyase/phosphoenolpyruvate mutase family protein [Rhodospirillaceae bacterium KN72]|uniref:Isocitrate lyase/phosphoenolpyruvate mutase family protein n=2 Tax=Pacificispira spongiicola TaxID=2729598 RepID=A0A7Y0E1M6_9PROT|nr:isocitrate lyase/phosphoenolpyruvate mutase family protein [Pacificispira spongiicola]
MTVPTTMDQGAVFRAMHYEGTAFVIPNPWDVGSARVLAKLGFRALATTSAGMAHSMGMRDGSVPRDAVLDHCRCLAAATSLPVSADLEKGFGDTPDSAAETIRAAAATGIAGCSIEDHTGNSRSPIFDFELAVERIAAAVEAARGLGRDFVLTARCENFLWDRPDLNDTVRRLSAFAEAGADVLYAPGLPDIGAVREVCAIGKPVNFLNEVPGGTFDLQELSEAGVARVSVGAALSLFAWGGFVKAARELAENGRFTSFDGSIGFAEMDAFF